MERFARLAPVALSLLLASCGPPTNPDAPDGGGKPDAHPSTCNPSWDEDGDGIPNGIEGCQLTPPRDTDGDGTPDYQDTDSDGDGVPDAYEDRNGDGIVGTCTTTCAPQDQCDAGYYCDHPMDGATIGYCVSRACLGNETDPHAVDTDGDGAPDNEEGTYICNPRSDDANPHGLKEVKYVDSTVAVVGSAPNWRIALEPIAADAAITVASPGTYDSAYLFDLSDPSAEVAGVLVSHGATGGELDAVSASQHAIERLAAIPGATLALRASGTRNLSLDGHDTVLGTTVLLTFASATDATAVRAQVAAALIDRASTDLTFPAVGWTGATSTQLLVRFQTLRRTDEAEVLFMGGVAVLDAVDDPLRPTGFYLDDLSSGTGLTFSGNGEAVECELFLGDKVPQADIIWVMDESSSMDDDRDSVASNAVALFDKAKLAGLDFRMGVTDMHAGRNGKFARRVGAGTDRWLLPTEVTLFQADIIKPSGPDTSDLGTENGLTQGHDAISYHLPRSDTDDTRIRTEAQLVLIYATDEHAQETEDEGILTDGDNTLASASQLAEITSLSQPYIDQITGESGIAHVIAVPESSPDCSSGGEIGYGYFGLVSGTGGEFGSVCQSDLGPTMDAIIDDIIGASSPIALKYVPIASTLEVTRDNVLIPRSRSEGWDYRASSNAIVVYNMPFNPAAPSEIVVSYRRWEQEVIVE